MEVFHMTIDSPVSPYIWMPSDFSLVKVQTWWRDGAQDVPECEWHPVLTGVQPFASLTVWVSDSTVDQIESRA